MIVNFVAAARRAAVLVFAAAMVLVAGSGAARADEGESAEVEAQRLVHILGYTAGDYSGAVANGAIVSETEYAEQLTLLGDAAKTVEKIAPAAPAGADGAALVQKVERVRWLVAKKASEADVKAAVEDARAAVSTAFRLSEAPATPPDAARGQALYVEHCASCHGVTGRADTQRAASLNPHPANFFDPKVGEPLSPQRIEGTIRFGINGTAMVPFTFLRDADRWSIAYYVAGLRHQGAELEPAPAYTLSELAIRSDAQLVEELAASGVPEGRQGAMLASLRRRAPFEAPSARQPLAVARAGIDRARAALRKDDRKGARAHLVDAYLEGVEPVEAGLRAADRGIVPSLEKHFLDARGRLESGAPAADVEAELAVLLGEVTRAEMLLSPSAPPSALATALSSAGIVLREGVEAALLIAALLGIAAQAGLGDRKRWVHAGWISAAILGVLTWFAAVRLIAISGAAREQIEGYTSILATLVLFYVSYSLLAKKEVARWMRFLRAHVTPARAALSLFGVAFLAAYREAFETVLFYQALLSSSAAAAAAAIGAGLGAVALVVLVAIYTRAGRFAPPQAFFKFSSYLLYGFAVVFAGQGIAALQLTGTLPMHRLAIPELPALGIHATWETCSAQALLLALAAYGALVGQKPSPAAAPPLHKTA
jgi:high-affinity iron transporter